jgi:hypothetical protein
MDGSRMDPSAVPDMSGMDPSGGPGWFFFGNQQFTVFFVGTYATLQLDLTDLIQLT